MSKLGRADTLAEVIGHNVDERLLDVHTAIPAKVTAYDATKQQLSCQVLVKTRHETEDGEEVAATVAEVHGVPICFPSLGAMGLTFPVPLGSFVLLVFAERSLDRWLAGAGAEVDPADVRSFHLSDAIAIPGIRPFGAPLADVPTDVVCIHGDMKLGAPDATDFAALASVVDANFQAIKTAALGLAGGADALAVKAALGTGFSPDSCACTMVKVK